MVKESPKNHVLKKIYGQNEKEKKYFVLGNYADRGFERIISANFSTIHLDVGKYGN